MKSMILNFFRNDAIGKFAMQFSVAMILVVIFGSDAMAQFTTTTASGATTTTGLCSVATWIKTILTGAAIIAIMIYVINSFFVKSSIVGDIIMYVIIGCAVAATASYFIGLTGLTTSCTV